MQLKSHTEKNQKAKLGVSHLYGLGFLQIYSLRATSRKLFVKIWSLKLTGNRGYTKYVFYSKYGIRQI